MLTDADKDALIHFRSRLPIDQFKLEVENSQQPALYDDVGRWVSGVRAASKVAKEHIEFVKADLSSKIRKNPDEYGLTGKITNDSVGAIVTTHHDYQYAVEDYIDKDRLANEASVLLSSVEQRRSAISNLVRLFVHAYYLNDKPVSDSSWKDDEAAIIALRDQRGHKEDIVVDDLEEELE